MTPPIHVEDLHLAFKGEGRAVSALNGLEAKFETGRVHALVGPNGAGKSTLLRVVGERLTADRGTVVGFSVDSVRAYITQDVDGAVFSGLSLEEHLFLAGGLGLYSPREARAALRSRFSALVPTLAGRLNATPGELSGGERQLLAIVCALIRRPDVLLLDEATASLDPSNIDLFWEAVETHLETERTTVLFVSHDPAQVLAHADEIHIMAVGRIQESLVGEHKTPEALSAAFNRASSATLASHLQSPAG